MSFTKTISTVAALASIFGAGAAGWKLAQNNNQEQQSQPVTLEQKIQELEKQLKESQQPNQATSPSPVVLPPVQPQVPQETQLPPPPPPPISQNTPNS